MKTKLKIAGVFLVIAAIVYGVFSMEFMQKKVYDKKADMVGTDRTIIFYAPCGDNKELDRFSDKKMRFDMERQGEITAWGGEANKKVSSNATYIIKDN